MHQNYSRLVALAAESHSRGRDPFLATERDIALARLYSYAFRRHVIGAFHATRQKLGGIEFSNLRVEDRLAALQVARATHVARVKTALDEACALTRHTALQTICDRFASQMEAITSCNGLSITRDKEAPAQGSFVVPNLGITIVPLVYGDHHSWNLAWLDGERSDVPCHLHREGVEIHLGYSPLHGHTILGNSKAEVKEGYAMPIPPGTRHGYSNIGTLTHHLPFIFGSSSLGGWGVFLDVEARPTEAKDLADVPVTAQELNGTVFLEREIGRAAAEATSAARPRIRRGRGRA